VVTGPCAHLPALNLCRVAPEVLMGGRNCTVAVDIYSFSVVLWEIFTGKRCCLDIAPRACMWLCASALATGSWLVLP